MRNPHLVIASLITAIVAGGASAGSIVQTGIVSGSGAPMTQDVILNQFDDQGGTLALTKVQMDFLTSVSGGFTATGSGVPVHIIAQLDAEWSLDGNLIADTQALVDTVVPNTSPISASVFNTDTASYMINNPGALAAWTGTGTIALQVFTQLQVSEDPAGIIGFGAGGTVRYTVTFEYAPVPAPSAIALLGIAGCVRRRRRR